MGPTTSRGDLDWLLLWSLTVVFQLFDCSEKADLEGVAAAKIKQLTAELEKAGSNQFDPVEKLKSGFVHFKTEKFE